MKLISVQNENKMPNEKIFKNLDTQVIPTQLGRAVLASSLSPTIAIRIFNDLEHAQKSLCLDSELHMLYLVYFV